MTDTGSSGSNSRIKEVFLQAQKLPAGPEREACLNRVCANDPQLRKEVESLLAADAANEHFLEKDLVSEALGSREELIGTLIGRYRILEWLGEGGFGEVYRVEQTEPIQRELALKIIKPGMDSREVIARFEDERQALGLMDHPNIAHVYDADATENGLPYFVMELVRGGPITTFCDEKQLSIRDRLKLFMQVCGAVQHAHQKGIIHRDLKPSNIVITTDPSNSKALPKIIDFGIAKSLQVR